MGSSLLVCLEADFRMVHAKQCLGFVDSDRGFLFCKDLFGIFCGVWLFAISRGYVQGRVYIQAVI